MIEEGLMLKEVKFYAFKYPYKALIISENEDMAKDVYSKEVMEILEEVSVQEINKIKALRIISDSIDERGEKTGLSNAKEQLDKNSEWFQIATDVKGLTLVVDMDLM